MTIKLLALQEVADALGVDVQTVRRWVHAGKLRAFKPGKEYRVRESDLEEFLRAREVRPKAPRRSPSEPSLFNGLAEERRTRDLERIEKVARALHGLWSREVERNEFDLEAYERAGEAYMALDAAVADAMTAEFVRDEEGASQAYREAWHRAWQATHDLQSELQRARYQLVDRLPEEKVAEVFDLTEYRDARDRWEAPDGRSSAAG